MKAMIGLLAVSVALIPISSMAGDSQEECGRLVQEVMNGPRASSNITTVMADTENFMFDHPYLNFAPSRPGLYTTAEHGLSLGQRMSLRNEIKADLSKYRRLLNFSGDRLSFFYDSDRRFAWPEVDDSNRDWYANWYANRAKGMGLAEATPVWEIALVELDRNTFRQSRELISKKIEDKRNYPSSWNVEKFFNQLWSTANYEAEQIGGMFSAMFHKDVPVQARVKLAHILRAESDGQHAKLADRLMAWQLMRLDDWDTALDLVLNYYNIERVGEYSRPQKSFAMEFGLPYLKSRFGLTLDQLMSKARLSQLVLDLLEEYDKKLVPVFLKNVGAGRIEETDLDFLVQRHFSGTKVDEALRSRLAEIFRNNPQLLDHPSVSKVASKYPGFERWLEKITSY